MKTEFDVEILKKLLSKKWQKKEEGIRGDKSLRTNDLLKKVFAEQDKQRQFMNCLRSFIHSFIHGDHKKAAVS